MRLERIFGSFRVIISDIGIQSYADIFENFFLFGAQEWQLL